MNEAEELLRAVVDRAMRDADNIPGPVDGEDYVNVIVENIKMTDWLIREGRVFTVRWSLPYNFDDDYSMWRVDTDGLDGYFSDWTPEEEEDE